MTLTSRKVIPKGGENDASWSLSFVPISQEISDRKVGQVSEGFGSILSTLTNPEKSLPENRNR